MIVEERKQRLLEIIQKRQFVSLQDLKRATQTSISTVRRDLVALAAQGMVRRVHGGVEFIVRDRDQLTVKERRTIYQADKQAIAKRAAAQLQGGEMIFRCWDNDRRTYCLFGWHQAGGDRGDEFSPSCRAVIGFDDSGHDYWRSGEANHRCRDWGRGG